MRSLIKSHRRSSSSDIKPNPFASPGPSSGRDSVDQIDHQPTSRNQGSKTVISPLSTPNLQQLGHAQFTPPPQSGHSQSVLGSGTSGMYERGSSGSASSMSSPKKLLTPIKKLFSSTSYKHHSVPVSGDTLAQITSSTNSVPPKSSKTRKSAAATSYASLTKLTATGPPVETKVPAETSVPPIVASSLSTPIELKSESHLHLPTDSADELITMSSNAPSFVKGEENFNSVSNKDTASPMTPKLPLTYSENEDGLGTVTGKPNGSTEKLARFHITESDSRLNDEPHLYSSDDSSDSSQFSFVKDMKGGRNTSIKYYKTGTPSQKLEKTFANGGNIFDQEQLANDMDGMSDYDYENNGDDEDYDDFEDNGRYNNLFDDEEFEDPGYVDDFDEAGTPNPEFGYLETNADGMYGEEDEVNRSVSSYLSIVDNDNVTTPTLILIDSTYLNRINSISLMKTLSAKPYNRSYHMSINGIDKLDSLDPVNVELAGPFHQEQHLSTDDILENYLEIDLKGKRMSSATPTSETDRRAGGSLNEVNSTPLSVSVPYGEVARTPDLTSPDYLGLFDISSPMVNGITVGANLRHRFPKNDSDENIVGNRSFINRGRGLPEEKLEKYDLKVGSLKSSLLPRNEKDVLKLRSVKSFHSSISDTFELKIHEKVKRIESFQSGNDSREFILSKTQPDDGVHDNNSHVVENNDNSTTISDNGHEIGLGLVYSPPSTSVDDIALESSVDSEFQRKLDPAQDRAEMRDQVPSEMVQTRERRHSLRNSVLSMMDLLGSLEKHISNPEVVAEAAPPLLKKEDESDALESGSSKKRLSIANMMNILADLEKNQSEIVEERDKELQVAKANRNSILDMMSTLAKLETDTSDVAPTDKKRDSINKMMATLAKLSELSKEENENEPETQTQTRPRRKSSERRDSKALRSHLASLKKTMQPRYSWFDNDESVLFQFKQDKPLVAPRILDVNKAQRYSFGENLITETSNPVLDDDLLDEINKLPEDFDFDEYELAIERSKSQKQAQQPEFFRSNSYNKKPVKNIVSLNFASNKIETLNKTVTIYHNKHMSNTLDNPRGDSLSRGPSLRSVNSFVSVNEEDESEDDDDEDDDDDDKYEYEAVANTGFYNDYSKNNLTTITESPNIR